MFYLRGLMTFLTFPGVVLHEFSHKKFCDWLGVHVFKVAYFRFGDPLGYVLHEEPRTYRQVFWISIGPLIINSLSAVIFSFVAIHSVPVSVGLAHFLFLWLAFSSGLHAFPSDKDMEHISSKSKAILRGGGSWIYLLSFPLVFLIWIANKLKFLWFDLAYAFFLIVIGAILK
jgi:hypothetical protein